MSAPLPSLPVTFRPTRTRVVLYSVGLAQFAALTAIALALPNLSGGERLSFVLTGLLVLAVLLLLARPKVVAHQEGVTVVNLTTKRELAWAQVVRVNLRVGDPWVHLDLADGTSLPAMGIQPGIARDQAIRDARALRDLTEKHGAVDHTAG
ncbi:PH domain-containing protein [Streptomyces tubercidicus]|uniref:Membrane protein n=1 Tax=Streptomyces tubercidicus TaxID=47759 RepID=A0A640V0Q4_9ACTN|nr:PH domain-containing protein [Streptomyces tubercidicus]WAU15302.1 PH domain-containing protein [Streptomyces tubercidicus]WSK38348.1 PH domain-containing protein [Streptomyces tubercidicus]WSX19404.1 PH domain-containing protein [Streptomyces tubercidicus]GFE41132.1 membrane protein [Streptomyces tubercidicus]